jgi:lactate dehydrogenase-like 2-hydroxyacid dehydrogenase
VSLSPYNADRRELDEYGQRATIVYPDISSREAFLAEVKEKHSDAVAIFATNGANIGKYDEELLTQLPESLKYICWHGAGYDPVDVNTATKRGIQVSHTPQAVDHGTATTALYLLIGALRQFAHAEMNARKGDWLKDFPLAHDPEGRVLGIVGMGGIGKVCYPPYSTNDRHSLAAPLLST